MKQRPLLTIVMYHYVRDLSRSRYPGIKALTTSEFSGQLDFIQKHYTVCSGREVVAAVKGESKLPQRACLLTFDDGFLDHFVTVFPMLEERGLTGCFFPPSKAIVERCLLGVHKLQLVLAVCEDAKALLEKVFHLLKPHRRHFDIPEDAELWQRYAVEGKYDPIEIVLIKRLLQARLPEPVREDITDDLFRRNVAEDESVIVDEWYLTVPQLKTMHRHGMEVGSHAHSHRFLETLSDQQQEQEILNSVELMLDIWGQKPSDWIMCYPAGSYDRRTIDILQRSGCAMGLAVETGVVSNLKDPYTLPRLDTNDLPFTENSESRWLR